MVTLRKQYIKYLSMQGMVSALSNWIKIEEKVQESYNS